MRNRWNIPSFFLQQTYNSKIALKIIESTHLCHAERLSRLGGKVKHLLISKDQA